MITTDRVVSAFRKATGFTLATPRMGRFAPQDYAPLRLDSSRIRADGRLDYVPAPAEARQRFGNFTLTVYEKPLAVTHPLGRGGPSRDSAVSWGSYVVEVGPDAGRTQWIASKVYDPNVTVEWYPPRDTRRLLPQWRRLDATISKIVASP